MKVLANSQATRTQSENTSSDFMACIRTRLHGTSSIYRSVSDAVLNFDSCSCQMIMGVYIVIKVSTVGNLCAPLQHIII